MSDRIVTVRGKQLKLTNGDKVLYPEAGFTKGEVIDYYERVAGVLLPHLKGRALTMKRYPNGVDEQFFFQKDAPKHRPDWIRSEPIWTRSNGRYVNFLTINSLPALVWIANLASLELHTTMSRARTSKRPTMMVFDLDPGPPATVVECCRVALMLRELAAGLGLDLYPKTSGSKGLQVYVPLNTPSASFEQTKPFARAVAKLLEDRHPGLVVSNMRRELREGRVLVDWSQNDDMKTTISVYSLRARPRPTVSTPVTWDEVEASAEGGDPTTLTFQWSDVLERIGRHGDLFEPVLKQRQQLPEPPA
jgi:bifunctional non-homologous end joining protein LigD